MNSTIPSKCPISKYGKQLALLLMSVVFFMLYGWFFIILMAFLYFLNVFFNFEANAKDILLATAMMVCLEIAIKVFGWMIGGVVIALFVSNIMLKASKSN